jgi:hypothetical protein
LAAVNKRANNYNLRNPKQSLQQQAASSNQNIFDGAAGKSGRMNSFKVLNEMVYIKQDNTSIKKEFPAHHKLTLSRGNDVQNVVSFKLDPKFQNGNLKAVCVENITPAKHSAYSMQ